MSTVRGRRARMIVGGVLGVVMVLGTAACGGGNGDDGARTADVTMEENFRYDPNRLEIGLDREETFTFFNSDDVVHNVTVSFLDVDVDVAPGERGAVTIPAVAEVPRDGFFTFYCKYHQTEGMSGRINISR